MDPRTHLDALEKRIISCHALALQYTSALYQPRLSLVLNDQKCHSLKECLMS